MMPNVPRAPGVPSLIGYAADALILLAADALSALLGFGSPRWGIYLDGALALEVNSFVSFDYKQDWAISDYPVEDGGFQSYDKVQLPFDVRVRVTSGGSAAERQALIDEVTDIANSLELYDVVTPERVYSSVNVSHFDIHRTATGGVGMIVCDIWFLEIRVTSTAAFTNTQQPGDAGQQNIGNVQPQAPESSVQQNFDNGNWSVQ